MFSVGRQRRIHLPFKSQFRLKRKCGRSRKTKPKRKRQWKWKMFCLLFPSHFVANIHSIWTGKKNEARKMLRKNRHVCAMDYTIGRHNFAVSRFGPRSTFACAARRMLGREGNQWNLGVRISSDVSLARTPIRLTWRSTKSGACESAGVPALMTQLHQSRDDASCYFLFIHWTLSIFLYRRTKCCHEQTSARRHWFGTQ